MQSNPSEMQAKTHGKNRNFLKYLIATSTSAFGTFFSSIAVILLVYQWTHSGIILSFFELASISPPIAMGVFIGNYLQGKDSKKVWLLSSFFVGILEIFVILFFNIYSLFILNLFVSIQSIFVMISKNAILRRIVDPEELSWANNTIYLSILIIGAISPFLVSFILYFSPLFPFIVDAITYFIEALFVYTLYSSPLEEEHRKKESMFGEILKNIKILNKEAKIVIYAIIFMASLFFVGGANRLLIVGYINRYFPANYYMYYGLRSALDAVGMIIIMVPITFKKIVIKNPYRVFINASLFYPVFYFIMALLVNPLALMGSALILGIGNGFVSPQTRTVLLKYTPKNILKPTLGLFTTLTRSATLISIIFAGVLMDYVDTRIIFFAFGIILMLIIAVFYPTKKFEEKK